MRLMLSLSILFSLLAAFACSRGEEAPDPERVFLAPLPDPPTGEDGRHHLADRPLKVFSENLSDAWKSKEAIEQAKQRQKEYRDKHSAIVDPLTPDPMHGMPLPLARALVGVEGAGPLRAGISTTRGTISCELLPDRQLMGVSHFVGLARGGRPWWDAGDGQWQTEAFYRNLPVYRITPGEAFFTGCPMGVGFAEIGFRVTPTSLEEVSTEAPPGTLGIPISQKTMTMGPQFFITGKSAVNIGAPFIPIGTCEAGAGLDALLAEPIGEEGLPINDVVLIRIDISRKAAKAGTDGQE